jgi:hypothetical protein
MSHDLCHLSIRIGRQERLRLPVLLDDLIRAGQFIAKELPQLEQTGRVTITVSMRNVTHIISRSRS